MTTFVVTPEPSHVPPRVRIDMDTEVVGSVFTAITVQRNGTDIRSQPPVGSKVTVAYDYEAPFAEAQTWTVTATVADSGVADWTENWASLASWSGDTGSWSVAAGVASSSTVSAAITRTVSGTIGRVDVTSPVLVRVEVLDAGNAVVASAEVGQTAITVGTSSGYSQTLGSGSFNFLLASGYATASGTGWTVARAFTGTPIKVRLVALGAGAIQSASWSTTGDPRDVVVDATPNVYVTDLPNKLIRKYNASGVAGITIATTGSPSGVAVDGSGNLYVCDITNKLIRKFNSAGVAGITFSTTGNPLDVAVDGSGNIYVCDSTASLVRKYNSAGVAGITFSTTNYPTDIVVDGSGNIYVCDSTANLVRKFNSAGVAGITFSTTGLPTGITLDGSGNIYVSDFTNKLIRKYNSSGTQTASFSTTGSPYAVAVDGSSNVYVADGTGMLVRKYAPANTSIGSTVARLLPATTDFAATDTDSLTSTQAWLIHPSDPDLSIPIDNGQARSDGLYTTTDSAKQITRGRRAEVFAPIGRERDVVVTNGNRRVGDWSLNLFASRIADRDAVVSINRDQTPLLLRVPPAFGWDLPDDWYSVGDIADERTRDRVNDNQRSLTLPLTPVDPPEVAQGSQWTWGDVLLTYSTWADVLADNATWLDVLVGPQ